MDESTFTAAFGSHPVPKSLIDLCRLEASVTDFLSAGFELFVDPEQVGLKTYSEDPEFLQAFIEFAQADGGGSTYAFWLDRADRDLNDCPIVVFGNEGGLQAVARNLDEFYRILSFDAEPMVEWESVTYDKYDDHSPSGDAEAYQQWLSKRGLEPTEDANGVVAAAQTEYQQALTSFLGKYYEL